VARRAVIAPAGSLDGHWPAWISHGPVPAVAGRAVREAVRFT